jgi:hypothetical protein
VGIIFDIGGWNIPKKRIGIGIVVWNWGAFSTSAASESIVVGSNFDIGGWKLVGRFLGDLGGWNLVVRINLGGIGGWNVDVRISIGGWNVVVHRRRRIFSWKVYHNAKAIELSLRDVDDILVPNCLDDGHELTVLMFTQ